jgi:Ca2+-binding EF-hand superfamily protein
MIVVNTSCVDGCIVFIDPISFSVLKKVQLRYKDYEIPKAIKASIKSLKQVFENISKSTGDAEFAIIHDIVDKDTHEIPVREFVETMYARDKNFTRDSLYKMAYELDEDNSGSISLDEFIHYFQVLSQEEQEQE